MARRLTSESASIQQRNELCWIEPNESKRSRAVTRCTEISPLKYFSAAFSNLQKVLDRLARLARSLQFPGQAQRKAL
jgi:hypothetical protein